MPTTAVEPPDFEALFEATTPCLILSNTFVVVTANPAYLRVAQRERQDLVGRNIFELFPDNPSDPAADGVANLTASLRRVLETGEPDSMAVQKYDIAVRGPDGLRYEERYWNPRNTPLLDAAGQVTHIIHNVEDVTDFVRAMSRADRMEATIAAQALDIQAANRRLAEANASLEQRVAARTRAQEAAQAQLRDSEQRFRLLADSIPQIVWIVDAAGQGVYFNRQWSAYTGVPIDSTTPEQVSASFVHPDDHAITMRAWEEANAAGAVYNVEHRIRSASGTYRWFLVRAEPVHDENGRITQWFGTSTDVHDSKLAEVALRRSEERYRSLFTSIDEGFCVVEFIDGPHGPMSDYVHLEANPAYVRHAGISDIVGKTGRDTLTLAEADGWVEMLGAVLQTGEPIRFERELEATGRHLEVACFPIGPRSPQQVAILFKDVTARKRAEDELRASEARLSQERARLATLVDSLPVGVCFLDPSGRALLSNPAFRRLLPGEPMPSRLAAGAERWLAWDSNGERLPRDRYPGARALRGEVTAGIEFLYRADGGREIWTRVSGFPLTGPDGNVNAALVVIVDIDQQKRAQEALQRLNATLEAEVAARTAERDRMWDTSPDLMLVIDFEGYLRRVNPAWTQLLGYSPEELVGRHVNRFVLSEDHASTTDAYVAASTGGRPRIENRYRHKDGSVRWISWAAAPAGDMTYATGRDVTAEKQREADLERAQEALRQSQKMEAVGQLTGGLAHDFNNLLASISGSLQVLKLKLQRGQIGELQRYIDMGESSVRRAASLTQRLLAFSRRQTLDPKPTDVERLVAGMADLIRRTVGPTIDIEVSAEEGLWWTKVDASQLESALLNLCINGRDAMMPAGGKLTIAVANEMVGEHDASHELRPGQYVSIRVSDTGTGIAPNVVQRIFDPFYTTKPLGQGTGLGLSMVYGFVRQSEGEVRVETEVGVGTTMCLFLPRHDGAAQPEEPVETPSIEIGDGETVLVIEDERSVRDIVEEVLHDAGYRVITAQDGPTGLQILNSDTRVDLLVTDVGLPGGLNGRQVADAARVQRPRLKVLFVTGYADTAAVGNGRLDPGMEVMTKPFQIGALAKKVRALIDGRSAGHR